MKLRTAGSEMKRAVRWLVGGTLFLGLMFGMWALVEATNKEGQHDAQLLPFFALIPLLIGLYHLLFSRYLRTHR